MNMQASGSQCTTILCSIATATNQVFVCHASAGSSCFTVLLKSILPPCLKEAGCFYGWKDFSFPYLCKKLSQICPLIVPADLGARGHILI